MTNNNQKIKRFYNSETKQLHRFIPLFENNQDGMVMGVCMDSCMRKWINNPYGDCSLPSIRKGQMVLVSKSNRLNMSYKGEDVFQLQKVFNYFNNYEDNHLSTLFFGKYSGCWEQENHHRWKDYEEVN